MNDIFAFISYTKNKKFRLFYTLFVNWADQISAGQTSPKKSKIKSFYFITDVT